MTAELGTFGVWGHGSLFTDEVASGIEQLGYDAIWIGGSPAADLAGVEAVLAATDHIAVATGIVNIWTADALPIAASFHRIEQRYPGRFLLGVGVGHREALGSTYQRPYAALVEYLNVLDAEGVPVADRALAALGPKVLQLSADRSAGAHPYLTTPEHTREARELLGAGVLLAPEHKVVLDTDPERARAIGRPRVEKPYLGLSNYTNNLRRLGFTDQDLEGSGSDRLIDALVAHGDAATVAGRLTEHLDAGADHVAIQLLTAPGTDPLPQLATLADALGLTKP